MKKEANVLTANTAAAASTPTATATSTREVTATATATREISPPSAPRRSVLTESPKRFIERVSNVVKKIVITRSGRKATKTTTTQTSASVVDVTTPTQLNNKDKKQRSLQQTPESTPC